MVGFSAELQSHLDSGVSTLCRCWAITRKDGVSFGFTDHDLPLEFEGFAFKAETGLTASALAQSTGLSVDNSEAIGALNDAAVTDADIESGRFDGAEVQSWLVNWAAPDERWLQFRGSIGELRRGGGAFSAELRGLTDGLNQPIGRVYQKPCTAVLGDGTCKANLDAPGMRIEVQVMQVEDARVFTWGELPGFATDWFARGRLDILDGPGAGLWGLIKRDVASESARHVELWEPIRAVLVPGVRVRLTAGCDKRFETCQVKFSNAVNFQGFPDLPGEDWMVAVPKSSGSNSGGSLR
ncbi:MAG: DUF2163 domain-containing protein [Aliishimia sp.]